MQYVDTSALRERHPTVWNDVWRIIKTDAPNYADALGDPFFKQCITKFAARVELPLDDIPPRARPLIPADVITT
jgi:hypothetical protein